MSEEIDIGKYIVEFSLHDSSKGKLNTPERIRLIEKVIEKDPGHRVKKIINIGENNITLEVHCENGTLRYFKMYFPKALVAYNEFMELVVLKYGNKRLFLVKDEVIHD